MAFVAATLDTKAVFDTPMTLIPRRAAFREHENYLDPGRGRQQYRSWLMMLNSFIMAFGITVGKITVSMLSRSPVRSGSAFRCVTCFSG